MRILFCAFAILVFVSSESVAFERTISLTTLEELKSKGIKVEEYEDYTTTVFAEAKNIVYFSTKKNNKADPFRVEVKFIEKDGDVVEEITPAYSSIKDRNLKNNLKEFYSAINIKIIELKALFKNQIN